MRTLPKILLLAATIVIPTVAPAADNFVPSRMPELDDAYNSLVTIPGTNLTVAEVNGQMVVVLPNKRFAVIGSIVDTLERKELRTLEDVKAARRISISKLGVNYKDDLASVRYGTGPKEVVIFIDSECDKCEKILKEVRELGKEYTFNLVLMPLLSQSSVTNAARALCAANPQAAAEAVLSRRYDKLPIQPIQCAQRQLAQTWAMAMALSINAVPYIIAPNGETTLGLKDQPLAVFLRRNGA